MNKFGGTTSGLVSVGPIAGFISIIVTLGAVGLGTPFTATAQDGSCFMVNSSGRSVNLDKLCGGSSTAPGTATVTTAPRNLFQAKIKRRLGGTPVIDVTFNGNRTFEMIVDTGASSTLITRPMAAALRVPIVGRVQSAIADGSVVIFPVGQLASMSVDGAEVRNVQVAIADRMGIGLLGHDFLSEYDVKIKRDVVEFYRR